MREKIITTVYINFYHKHTTQDFIQRGALGFPLRPNSHNYLSSYNKVYNTITKHSIITGLVYYSWIWHFLSLNFMKIYKTTVSAPTRACPVARINISPSKKKNPVRNAGTYVSAHQVWMATKVIFIRKQQISTKGKWCHCNFKPRSSASDFGSFEEKCKAKSRTENLASYPWVNICFPSFLKSALNGILHSESSIIDVTEVENLLHHTG